MFARSLKSIHTYLHARTRIWHVCMYMYIYIYICIYNIQTSTEGSRVRLYVRFIHT